ncbi:NAD(P)-binding protein [Fomitopsis serialis]|uniref:NAD(P)-binding protein n=1 Tax=Fomitopsis serialis TaxID=139415 RepID=UPI002007B084|nr:NAD(P)-binding protein [Neoantrodia serialis]KAH9927258.1 NAD(P)-binding protein [Neoantrodia serialis]
MAAVFQGVFDSLPVPPPLLTLLCGAYAAYQTRRLLDFAWFYWLRPSSVHRYIHGPPAYALVTGASDGIGNAVARELYDSGFNLILHGRNEEKLRKVADEIRARGNRDVRYFIADASDPSHDFAKLVQPFSDLNVTVVIHNVGGSGIAQDGIDSFTDTHLAGIVHQNAMFHLLLTRALLPSLRTSAKRGPVIVHFVGSVTADITPPRLVAYAASKAFVRALARGLDNDEQLWGAPSGVRFACITVGEVQSNSHKAKASLVCPTADRFAKAVVAKIGCGRRQYTPWMPHAILNWVTGLLPEHMLDKTVAEAMQQTAARAKQA